MAHTAGRGSLVIRDPAAAQARSIEAARQKKEKLEREEYVRTLGYKEQLRYRLASKASMVADVIEGMLQDPDPNIRLRAAQEWANRVYGRPHTTAVVVEAPVESPIVQAFMELSPDERRALLRQGAAQIPPEHSDEA